MKTLFKSFIVGFVMLLSLTSEAVPTVNSWNIVTPLSGSNLAINASGQTQIKFTVNCKRSIQGVNLGLRLEAVAANGNSKAMHADVYVTTADFIGLAATKTFTVNVDLTDTYFPNQTTVRLVVTQGGAAHSGLVTYPVVVPIQNNFICCSSNYTQPSAPSTILTGTTPSGGNGSVYTYQWKYAVMPDTSTFMDITTNGTNADYTTPVLTQNTYYKRVVSSSSTPSVPSSSSNIICIKVNYVPQRAGVIGEDEANTETEISVYPNPFSNTFSVKVNDAEIKNIEIINANGVSIYKENRLENNLINADSWAPGIYFIQIETNENKIILKKIIKVQ